MLPPIPHSLQPVTAQQDVPKPRPEIPPVTPVEPSSSESSVSLEKRHPQETEELLRQEQRRRQQRRGYTAEQLARVRWMKPMRRCWNSCRAKACG